MHTKSFKLTDWLPACYNSTLFTGTEARDLVALTRESGRLYPGGHVREDGEPIVDTEFRLCETSHFVPGDELHERMASRVWERLDELNSEYLFDLYPKRDDAIPLINVNRYANYGDEHYGYIGMHTDVGGFEGCEDRKLSLTVLLSDSLRFKGGRFRIFDGRAHFPLDGGSAGEAVAFPSFYPHGVDPVLSGERFSAVIWVRGPRFR